MPSQTIDSVALGVDISKFRPVYTGYAYRALIPAGQKVVIYAGHMERRNGVHVLIEAAIELLRSGET